MANLNILSLFDNTSIINAVVSVDEIDVLASKSANRLITSNSFKVTAKKGDVAADIKYVLAGDKPLLSEVIITTRYAPNGQNDNVPLDQRYRTLAHINLKDVFENIHENEAYIQQWFAWLNKHAAVIDLDMISLSSVGRYEGMVG